MEQFDTADKSVCGALESNLTQKPLQPYSELVCDFLDAFSHALRHDYEAKQYPDVMTFAFWARKGSIQQKKEDYIRRFGDQRRLGKGTVFHIAPSNVPVNCMFTYAFGLLAGNANIVRVPSKDFPQVSCMLRVLDEVLKKEAFSVIKEMTSFVCYERTDEKYTRRYSAMCDMRVIWGGDDTIREIRKVELPPRSTEITFADRYSFGILDVGILLEMSDDEMKSLAEGFYNDTYLMDQNACSTPHLICFKKSGEKLNNEAVKEAKERFWTYVATIAAKYELADVKASDKYTDLCEKLMYVSKEGSNDSENAKEMAGCDYHFFNGKMIADVTRYDNLLYVCELSELPKDTALQCRGRYGMFFEYTFEAFDELSVLSDTRVQTCAVYGVDEDEMRRYIAEHGFRGIDRVVSFGKTLDIDTIWDGYDLINTMSRVIG